MMSANQARRRLTYHSFVANSTRLDTVGDRLQIKSFRVLPG
jgi:hypothetical protein